MVLWFVMHSGSGIHYTTNLKALRSTGSENASYVWGGIYFLSSLTRQKKKTKRPRPTNRKDYVNDKIFGGQVIPWSWLRTKGVKLSMISLRSAYKKDIFSLQNESPRFHGIVFPWVHTQPPLCYARNVRRPYVADKNEEW